MTELSPQAEVRDMELASTQPGVTCLLDK